MNKLTKFKTPINRFLTILYIVAIISNILPISPVKAAEPSPATVESIELLPAINPENLNQESIPAPKPAIDSAQVKPKPRVYQLEKKVYSSSEKITLVMDRITPTQVTSKLTDSYGKEQKVKINEFKKADFTIIEIDPSSSITPGKYTLTITTVDGQTSSQEFSWGVLALNTNKSIYNPNEVARIAMSVLNDRGEMVCDSAVDLKITDPEMEETVLSTQNGTIKINPECQLKEFTLTPDYEASYSVRGMGVYSLELTATTANGTRTVTDSFEVQTSPLFDVERVAATRIYPPLTYPVRFNITANQDFKGTITEVVPDSFTVSADSGVMNFSSVETVSEKQIRTESVLGVSLNLGLPFKGNYPLTSVFGELEDDPLLQKKYEQYGVIGHDGVDFALPAETPVYSVDDGVVVRATAAGDYGTTIIVEHSWGKSYYGHLSKLLAPEGKEVKKGSLLGLSGNTGLSTGPHLHFGIKMKQNDFQNGYYGKTDPLPLLGIQPTSSVLGIQAPENANVKVLSWDLDIKAGESVALGYKFKAPNISPNFYTIGPLQFITADTKANAEAAEFTDPVNPPVLETATASAELERASPPALDSDQELADSQPKRVVFAEIRQWQIAADAALPTLIPGAGATPNGGDADTATSNALQNEGPTACNAADCSASIDETIASTDDGTTFLENVNNNNATRVQGFELTEMPTDFSSMDTLTVDTRVQTTGTRTNDDITLLAQVFEDGGATALTDQVTVCTFNGTNTCGTTWNTITSTFALQGNNTKTVYDSAELHLTWTTTKTAAADGTKVQVSTAEIDGTYTATGGGGGPTNDQLMRHGNWFSSGVEQPFTF